VLLDMEGRVLHRWRRDFEASFPGSSASGPGRGSWRRVHLFPNGDLLAIFEGQGLVKLDRDSKLLWASPLRAHHDLDVLPEGRIWVLTREAHLVPVVDAEIPIQEDFAVLLGPDGEEERRVSLLQAFERSRFRPLWRRSWTHRTDPFHTNTLAVLDASRPGAPGGFAAGRLLVSMRHLHLLAVVDPESERVVWARRGPFRFQHDPSLLDDGRLLLFNNEAAPGISSVLELDPDTGEVAWEYRGREDAPFYSELCGTAQRLENGNTLVTESDNGRAFEITRAGEIVWEFVNPARTGGQDELVAALFELRRLPRDFADSWIDPALRSGPPRPLEKR
jgi:hypothetical protein